MEEEPLILRREGEVARLTMNRPAIHNAFDDRLIDLLTDALEQLAEDRETRIVILAGAGPSFSAGADLAWMRRMAGYDDAENLADARRLARLMQVLDELGKPTMALVDGAAIGGGVGLVACCDVAIATEAAVFALSETRLGLVPAVISPYVRRAIGERACRRLFLTGERIGAAEAHRLGLVHQLVPPGGLEEAARGLLGDLLACGPAAQAAAKGLLRQLRTLQAADAPEATASLIARVRAAPEGREGVEAFLAKRKPVWRSS
jgi:methylglutaconyl-CoA hydratase